jgi:hypothetical protein
MSPAPNAWISCRDECGARVVDDQAAMAAGWSYLSIRAAWRCGACARSLLEAARIEGLEHVEFVDQLPAGSRGALRKETASSIAAPVVKP